MAQLKLAPVECPKFLIANDKGLFFNKNTECFDRVGTPFNGRDYADYVLFRLLNDSTIAYYENPKVVPMGVNHDLPTLR